MRDMAPPYAKFFRAGPPGAQPQRGRPPTSRSPWPLVLPVIASIVVASIVFVFLVLPIVIRSRCIGMAADRGVVLTIDHVDIGLGEVRLVQVAFTLDGVPQLAAHATDAQVTLSGRTPNGASVHGLAIAMDGTVETVQGALDEWRSRRARDAHSAVAGSAQKIGFTQGNLTWTKPFGQTAKIDAPDVAGEVDAVTGALHLSTERLSLAAGSVTLGPWRTSLDRDEEGTRTVIELDPVVHGGPSVLYMRSAAGSVTIKGNVPRSPLSRIGFPPKVLRLGSDPDVEMQFGFEETLAGSADLTVTLSLSHAVFSGVPIDAALNFHAVGDVTKGLDVKAGTLKAGPLTAGVTGTVKLFGDGARLALACNARPISCTQMGKDLATQALGGLGAQLGSLAQDLGGVVGLRVTGEAQASGLMTLDSRDVSATSFTMTANETCGLALF